jgi:hypothetical protein
MKTSQLNLWSLLRGRRPRQNPRQSDRQNPHQISPESTTAPRKAAPRRSREVKPGGMADRYDRVTREMLATYGIRVRKWRTSMSGVAWTVTYTDGSISRLIESPKPKGPMSAAIFLHEVGHHAIGIGAVKPRCLEELRAWEFSLAAMQREGLNVTPAVRKRMHDAMTYAAAKAIRRGIKALPTDVVDYLRNPPAA